MTERFDHVAEAREALRGSGDGRNFATDASNNAIAHAVLALVEQQRIANIIAWTTANGSEPLDHVVPEVEKGLGWV